MRIPPRIAPWARRIAAPDRVLSEVSRTG
jgi:hypothetical protein